MQVRQLKTLLQSFAEFGGTACEAEAFADLRDFAAVFSTKDETTAKFVARLKKGLPKGETFACPRKLRMHLEGIASCLSAAEAKSSKDLSDLLAIFSKTHSTSTREFIQHIIAARDFVAPQRAQKLPKKPQEKKPKEKKPKVAEIVASYIESLQRAASLSAAGFAAIYDALRADDRLSDASVKKIAKALWGRTSKSRTEAFEHIQAFRNREALTSSSLKALDVSSI